MRKLAYYVAVTLDGFIAARDGNADFFPLGEAYLRQLLQEFPETFPGHARRALGIDAPNVRFDTLVMGQGTYDPALRLGITSPYPHLRQYVFSRSLAPSTDPAVTVVSGDPVPVVQRLKAEGHQQGRLAVRRGEPGRAADRRDRRADHQAQPPRHRRGDAAVQHGVRGAPLHPDRKPADGRGCRALAVRALIAQGSLPGPSRRCRALAGGGLRARRHPLLRPAPRQRHGDAPRRGGLCNAVPGAGTLLGVLRRPAPPYSVGQA